MSTASIVQVSRRLQALLRAALADDPSGAPTVVLDDPTVVGGGQETARVSLWLYQVAVDEFTRNATPRGFEEANGKRGRFRLPPLGVDLFYLVTPLLGNTERDQEVLAAVMLAFHENAVIDVAQADAEVNEQVRVSVMTGSLDERVRLWESLGKPYHLSVGYQVRTTRLVSKQVDDSGVVVSTTTGLSGQPAPAGGG